MKCVYKRIIMLLVCLFGGAFTLFGVNNDAYAEIKYFEVTVTETATHTTFKGVNFDTSKLDLGRLPDSIADAVQFETLSPTPKETTKQFKIVMDEDGNYSFGGDGKLEDRDCGSGGTCRYMELFSGDKPMKIKLYTDTNKLTITKDAHNFIDNDFLRMLLNGPLIILGEEVRHRVAESELAFDMDLEKGNIEGARKGLVSGIAGTRPAGDTLAPDWGFQMGIPPVWAELAWTSYDLTIDVSEIATAESEAGVPGMYGSIEDNCMGLDLGGQNWILCPTLENSAGLSDGFMAIIDQMLSVKSDLYKEDSGAHAAWEFFRTFANIALIIILLVIIFSQISGVGINNYGIKKMLPKFVVVAILINLSFLLCQIAVDISNILGDGLDNLLRGVASDIGSSSTLSGGNTASDIVGSFLALLAGTGTVVGFALPFVGMGLGAGVLIVIGFILALLVAVVSILIFFVMLGARMVIVIAFIAIAPIALVCNILPNTQTLFKKWWDVFKAALVMYPLCGLLYGLSFLIKAIFSSSGADIGFWEGIILLITPFLPFLVLPNLLKGALSGLGMIGGAITSVGNGLRRGTQGASQALQNSEAFKAQQEKGRRLADLKNSGIQFDRKTGEIMRDANGNVMTKDVKGIRKFLRGGDYGVARARARVLDNERTKAMENRLMGGTGLTAAVMSQGKAAKDTEIADYMTLINDRTDGGARIDSDGEDALWKEFKGFYDARDEKGMVAVARIAGRRKDTAGRFMEYVTGAETETNEAGQQIARPRYDSEVLKSAGVSREIAEGDNSGNFRSATPLTYEYMSQLNQQTAGNVGSYGDWKNIADNISQALEHHLGTRSDLLSAKSSQLKDIADLMREGPSAMKPEDVDAMRKLALESVKTSKENGTELDVTKVEQIYRIAYDDSEYQSRLVADGYRRPEGGTSGAGSNPPTPPPAPNA